MQETGKGQGRSYSREQMVTGGPTGDRAGRSTVGRKTREPLAKDSWPKGSLTVSGKVWGLSRLGHPILPHPILPRLALAKQTGILLKPRSC